MAAWEAPASLWAPSACSTTESTRGRSIGLKQLPTASVILGCSRTLCKTPTRAGSSLEACTDKGLAAWHWRAGAFGIWWKNYMQMDDCLLRCTALGAVRLWNSAKKL